MVPTTVVDQRIFITEETESDFPQNSGEMSVNKESSEAISEPVALSQVVH
jgi:hypothetical protein